MKVATWNINSINARLDLVLDWCQDEQPDVICFQETKCVDEKFPSIRFRSIGYEYQAFHGEKAYNGVAIISKRPINKVRKQFPHTNGDEPARLIKAKIAGVDVVNVYVPHGSIIGTSKFEYKLEWMTRLRKYFEECFKNKDRVLLCGDFNICPHETDVYNVKYWKDRLHFTKPEREAILCLKKWGFVDVFRQFNEEPDEYSWWDYFHHSFEKNQGLRIDHIWTSPPLADLCTDCWIDREPRRQLKTSDHAPVVADFLITEPN